jgi:acetate kinase
MGEQILIINGGSSSIKYAVYEVPALKQVLKGKVERIGLAGAPPNHKEAIAKVIQLLDEREVGRPAAIGHRIVHGGPKYAESQRVTESLIQELRRLCPLDPEHLPSEIDIVEALAKRYPDVPQVACFDTAFGRAMPRVAKIVAIPRKYEAMGVQRYGFHGLSYTFLMEEIARLDGADTARGRIVLAHLGNGASMAAVRDGKCIEMTMGLTPASGLVMSTRSGDIDPGLAGFLHRVEGMSPQEFHEMIHERSGLLGISETSPDIRDLLARRADDVRAREAVEVFCYQARKWIGALAAVLGGIDMIVISGGIGEHSPQVRREICAGLEFLGIRIDASANEADAQVISEESAAVRVRVIQTDEEQVMARETFRLLWS